MRIGRTVVSALGVLALSLALVACGGSGTSTSAPAPEQDEDTNVTVNSDDAPSDEGDDSEPVSDPFAGLSEEDLLDGSDASDEMSTLFDDETLAAQKLYVTSVTKTAELSVPVADDDTVRITVVGVGEDFEGDTGYLIEVENRTDSDLVVGNATTELDGADVYDAATLVCPVKAGETNLGFFFFDQSAATVTEASSCEALLALMDASENLLGAYTMSV